MRPSILPSPIAGIPWRVILPLTLLVCFGAAVLYSAAGSSMQPFATSHLLRYVIFLVMALLISHVPEDMVQWVTYPAYAGILLLLLAVEGIGAISGGSQRWLELGPIRIQPSEMVKPIIVLVLARFYQALPPSLMASWAALIVPGILIAVPMGMVLVQPDLGTALAVAFVGVVMIFLAGIPLRWVIGGGAAAILAIPVVYFYGLQDYQRRRVTTFMDPESDPLGAGYHITQSKVAIGSGGISGKGFGQGSQSHLNYLPEPHTDFVFATMAEEWGLIGGLFVLLVFGIILRWGLGVAVRAPDRFSRLVAAGMTATIFFYVAINLMMVMGLAPVVGIPLPFMSHGGSSMMTNMICIGALMMVERWSRRPVTSGFA